MLPGLLGQLDKLSRLHPSSVDADGVVAVPPALPVGKHDEMAGTSSLTAAAKSKASAASLYASSNASSS